VESRGACDDAYDDVGNRYDEGEGCMGRSGGCCAMGGIVLLELGAEVEGVCGVIGV
jgi:hypothetical protein